MSLLLLFRGGVAGPTMLAIDPANLAWVGQAVDVVQGGVATQLTLDPADLSWLGQSVTIPTSLPPAASIGAPMAYLPIKYGTATTINFDMIKAGALDFAAAADWTPVAGDVKIRVDQGTFLNTNSLPTAQGTDWDLPLTVSETTGKIISIKIIDSATKAVEDQSLKCFTFGHPAAGWPFDLSLPLSSQTVSTGQVIAAVTGPVNSVTNAVGSVTGNVGGNVVGSVGSVTVVSDKTGYSLANPAGFKKNTAWPNFKFVMYNSAGAPTAGLSVNGQVQIDAASITTLTNSVTGLGGGIYTVNLAAADLNGDDILLLFTATGALAREFKIVTEP